MQAKHTCSSPTSIQNTLKLNNCVRTLSPVSLTTWRKHLQGLESRISLWVIMVPSTAIPGIFSTALMSSSNLMKMGFLPHNELSRVPPITWCCRKSILKKAAADQKDLLKGCWSTPTFHLKISACHLHRCGWVGARAQWYQPIDVSYYRRQWILIELWKHCSYVNLFLRRITTNRVEICLPLKLGTRCGFGQIEIENGVKQKCCHDHTKYRMNEGASKEEISRKTNRKCRTTTYYNQIRAAS